MNNAQDNINPTKTEKPSTAPLNITTENKLLELQPLQSKKRPDLTLKTKKPADLNFEAQKHETYNNASFPVKLFFISSVLVLLGLFVYYR